MHFSSFDRNNPQTGRTERYYRLMMSYRDVNNKPRHRTVLNIGYLDSELTPDDRQEIAAILKAKYRHEPNLFMSSNERVKHFAEIFWNKIVEEKTLDVELYAPDSQHILTNSMRHEEVREVGAEWLAHNTWNELRLDDILRDCSLSEDHIKLAKTQVISRAINPASELATARIIEQNSAICELTGYPVEKVNKDSLYRGALRLLDCKSELEKKLSRRTNEIFNHEENIILYDLTNTYFEGEKRGSKLAQYGRSKEKRNDAKLVVLAMAINTLGFIKYSSIHEGNFADSSDITSILDNLIVNTGVKPKTVVLDAGIATEANLDIIRQKGYHYICVSRNKLKDYTYQSESGPVHVTTNSGKVITLKKVKLDGSSSYYFEINSPSKALKEQGMKTRFEKQFEEQLEIARVALSKPRGTKKIGKVHERIGRIRERFASTHSRYEIEVIVDNERGIATDITWAKDESKEADKQQSLGQYFLKTSMDMNEDPNVWHVYNLIREIEDSFRTLKSDLDLRPIYHKNDESTKAHLHLGLLAYWLVNTIRCKLKTQDINWGWQEILRIASTQKFITTKGQNTAGTDIEVRKCSEPEQDLRAMQSALGIRPKPIRIETKNKDVAHNSKFKICKAFTVRESPPI